MTTPRGVAAARTDNAQVFSFRLAAPLQLPNRIPAGKTWKAAAGRKAKARQLLALEVMALIGARPAQPLARASVQVFRHGIQAPDQDNLFASCKGLLDVLQPSTARRKYGLGIIAGDDPAHLELAVHHIKAAHRGEQGTVVVVREIA